MSKIQIRGMCPLLQVFDMPVAFRFYSEVLEFEVVEKSGPGDDFDWVWLHREGAHLMLNTQYESDQRPARTDPIRAEGHRDTGLFFNCPDVDAAYQHLLTHGLAVEPPVNRNYGMRQVYVKDPDGYMLCFQWPIEELEAGD